MGKLNHHSPSTHLSPRLLSTVAVSKFIARITQDMGPRWWNPTASQMYLVAWKFRANKYAWCDIQDSDGRATWHVIVIQITSLVISLYYYGSTPCKRHLTLVYLYWRGRLTRGTVIRQCSRPDVREVLVYDAVSVWHIAAALRGCFARQKVLHFSLMPANKRKLTVNGFTKVTI